MSTNKKMVSNVVHLEIVFVLDEIVAWINNNHQGDLLDKEKLDQSLGSNRNMVYKFDLLPHPNGVDSIVYHRQNNQFSSHLAAFHYFEDATYGKFPPIKNRIDGVSWDMHPLGLCVWISPPGKARKNIIVVPTGEVYQLQLGNRLDAGITDYRELSKETALDVAISQEESIKINRSLLGFSGNIGVMYRNILCEVRAYLSPKQIDYGA